MARVEPPSHAAVQRLAAALAKAQAELVNPEKSEVATIRSDGGGEPSRSFAMLLSSRLDVVRETLGQQRQLTA
jgi:hypothetical protein